jgi:hypothetical protein
VRWSRATISPRRIVSLDESADRPGYGEQASFGRAFKCWTGKASQKFRAKT